MIGGLAHPLEAGMLGVNILDFCDEHVRADVHHRVPGLELKYDEMYISYTMTALIAGELSHFMWRQLQLSLDNDARDAAREHIRKSAERILGEPWKLADEV